MFTIRGGRSGHHVTTHLTRASSPMLTLIDVRCFTLVYTILTESVLTTIILTHPHPPTFFELSKPPPQLPAE